MLVRLTRSAEVATLQEKKRKEISGLGRDTVENTLRTIVERENMLPRLARRAQQQIRLHEVTRIQWRRLALEFYKKQRVSEKTRCNLFVEHIQSAQNVPLVTRRKCSSTTEYLLSYKSMHRAQSGTGCKSARGNNQRRFAFTERFPK